jgi:hypothetical protein
VRPQLATVRLIMKSGQGDPAEVTTHRLTPPGGPVQSRSVDQPLMP